LNISMRLSEEGEGYFLPEDALDINDELEVEEEEEEEFNDHIITQKVGISFVADRIKDGMSKEETLELVKANLISPTQYYSDPKSVIEHPAFFVKFFGPEDITEDIMPKLMPFSKFNQIAQRATDENLSPTKGK